MNTTRELEKDYQLRKAMKVIEYYSELHEAKWLYDFIGGVVPIDENVVLLTLDIKDWATEYFSYLHPRVMSIYYGINLGLGTGIGLDYFVRGAVTASSIVDENQLDMITHMLKLQHEYMYEKENYPYIAEKFLGDYVSILTTVLVNPETSTWRQMLAFVSGVYWLLSFVDTSDDDSIIRRIYDILIDRAKKGFIDFI